MTLPPLTPGIALVSVLAIGAAGGMGLDLFGRRKITLIPICAFTLAYITSPAAYFLWLLSGLFLAAIVQSLLNGAFRVSGFPLREAIMSLAAPLAVDLMPADPMAGLLASGFAGAAVSGILGLRRSVRTAAAVFSSLSLAYGGMALTLPVYISTMAYLPRSGGWPIVVSLGALSAIIWIRQQAIAVNRTRMDRLQRLSVLSDHLLSSSGAAEYLGELVEFLEAGGSSKNARVVSRIPDGEGWIAWGAGHETPLEPEELVPPSGAGNLSPAESRKVLMALDSKGEMLLECSGSCGGKLRALDDDTRRGLAHVLYHTWQAMGHSMHQQEAFLAAAMMLARLADAKDTYTHGHSLRVAEIATSLGEMFGLRGDSLKLLRVSALLHDIGKIAIPREILTKRGLLTREERRVIERHPEEGAAIVSNLTGYEEVSRVIRSHHERLDGSGYPDGLKNTAIPFMARVVAVADTFDAITSTRSYHSDTDHRTALDTIMVGSGQQFDSRVVAMLKRALDQSPDQDRAPW